MVGTLTGCAESVSSGRAGKCDFGGLSAATPHPFIFESGCLLDGSLRKSIGVLRLRGRVEAHRRGVSIPKSVLCFVAAARGPTKRDEGGPLR